MERIYVSKKLGTIYTEKDGKIDLNNEIQRDLKNYKLVGGNNVFNIYDQKKSKK